jgi:hypothetical protein
MVLIRGNPDGAEPDHQSKNQLGSKAVLEFTGKVRFFHEILYLNTGN